jgi:outer membrane immunogenic protein
MLADAAYPRGMIMRYFRCAALAAVAVFGFASVAFAADLPTKAPVYNAPPPAVASTWTGFYVGAGVGARWMDSDWTATAAFDPTGPAIPFATDPSASFSSAAFRISGYAGYNWQVAPVWVVGLEGDFGWANNHDTLGSRIPGLGVLNGGSFTEVKGSWDASLRARAGYLINPTLLAYVAGGAAFQHVEAIATCPGDVSICKPASLTRSFSNSNNRVGWTVGGGLETMIMRNWLARIEYRYSDLGSFSFTAIPFTASTFGANANLSTTTQIVTVGLGYKF